MEKTCLYCGKKYEAKSKKSKYCCEKCKSNYKYRNMKNHVCTCKFCGKEFISYRSDVVYCSKKCASFDSRGSKTNIYKLTDYIAKNPQIQVSGLSSAMGLSSRTIYKILEENGFHSYMEFVGTVKGVYIEKTRADSSVSSLACFDLFSKVLEEDYILEKKFEGLVNPMTGYSLRIDCYFPKSNIAIEYNGIQHYKYIPFFHSERNTLEYQQYKDFLKEEYCRENKIELIVFNYKEELTIDNVKRLLSRANQHPSRENSDDSTPEGSTTNG